MTPTPDDREKLYERLSACAETLQRSEQLTDDDAAWLSSILKLILGGHDIRFTFFHRTRPGR
ncbi:MAG TPA: hypothetical protein VN692_12860, partial [Steroidobacteraceae bacterium]|nr:hypothetical protein [Steroidobacteraceae bacterium]